METEPMPHYEIREATLADIEPIRRMQALSWRDTYENDELGVTKEWLEVETDSWMTEDKLAKSHEMLSSVFENPDHFYRVALQAQEVVGLLHLATKEDGTKHLWGLYTAKRTHGTGLAQELMHLATEWIGDNMADLDVASYNERAKAFYRKYGFVEQPGIVDLYRDKIPSIRMIRKGEK